jgi:hypothetical protein
MLKILRQLLNIDMQKKTDQVASDKYDQALCKADRLIIRLEALEDILVLRKAKRA